MKYAAIAFVLTLCFASPVAAQTVKPAPTNDKQAALDLKNLRSRAERGNAKAQYRLGLMYVEDVEEEDRHVTQDLGQAIRWIRKAAVRGYAPAQTQLGAAYAHGHDYGRMDDADARSLCRMAHAQGDTLGAV
ncbi:MAG: hypothetical protein LBV29_06645, partial [Azoarcus sp.]|nr:hypothetical protein [Azoarcus sp.]